MQTQETEWITVQGIIKSIYSNKEKLEKKLIFKADLLDPCQEVRSILAWEDMAKICEQYFHENDMVEISGEKIFSEFWKKTILTVRSNSVIRVNKTTVYKLVEPIKAEITTADNLLTQEQKQLLEDLPIKRISAEELEELERPKPKTRTKTKTVKISKPEIIDDGPRFVAPYSEPKPLLRTDTQTKDLTKEFVRTQINPLASDIEIAFFIELCKQYNLNPFLDIHLIKYSKDSKAQTVVAKDYHIKNARKQKDFLHYRAGIVVISADSLEEIKLDGSYHTDQQKIDGGWAEVYYKEETGLPFFTHSVKFSEYNKNQASWKEKPATMIRKVALVQALRECFPEAFSQLYDSSEMGVEIPE